MAIATPLTHPTASSFPATLSASHWHAPAASIAVLTSSTAVNTRNAPSQAAQVGNLHSKKPHLGRGGAQRLQYRGDSGVVVGLEVCHGLFKQPTESPLSVREHDELAATMDSTSILTA